MLEGLQGGDFAPYIGRPCRLECDEIAIDTVLDAVDKHPGAGLPRTAPGSRIPFVLLLRGAPDCPWESGTFTLRIEGMAGIPGIYVNRVMHAGPDSLFQVIFN